MIIYLCHGEVIQNHRSYKTIDSTTTALLKCTDDWLNGIDAGKYAGVVFVDLKKAFDTVDHFFISFHFHFKIFIHKSLSAIL